MNRNVVKPFYWECSRNGFSSFEQKLIDRYGLFMSSLAQGKRVPTTEEQKHFIKAIEGEVHPVTIYEKIWLKYSHSLKANRTAFKAEKDATDRNRTIVQHLTDEEKKLIETKSIRILTILRGNQNPTTDFEKRILEVVLHNATPQTREEIAWQKYCQLNDWKTPRGGPVNRMIKEADDRDDWKKMRRGG